MHAEAFTTLRSSLCEKAGRRGTRGHLWPHDNSHHEQALDIYAITEYTTRQQHKFKMNCRPNPAQLLRSDKFRHSHGGMTSKRTKLLQKYWPEIRKLLGKGNSCIITNITFNKISVVYDNKYLIQLPNSQF